MATYDYKCWHCGHVFYQLQPMSAPATQKCPKCGCASTRTIAPPAGIHFKGTGFYATDYRGKGKE